MRNRTAASLLPLVFISTGCISLHRTMDLNRHWIPASPQSQRFGRAELAIQGRTMSTHEWMAVLGVRLAFVDYQLAPTCRAFVTCVRGAYQSNRGAGTESRRAALARCLQSHPQGGPSCGADPVVGRLVATAHADRTAFQAYFTEISALRAYYQSIVDDLLRIQIEAIRIVADRHRGAFVTMTKELVAFRELLAYPNLVDARSSGGQPVSVPWRQLISPSIKAGILFLDFLQTAMMAEFASTFLEASLITNVPAEPTAPEEPTEALPANVSEVPGPDVPEPSIEPSAQM